MRISPISTRSKQKKSSIIHETFHSTRRGGKNSNFMKMEISVSRAENFMRKTSILIILMRHFKLFFAIWGDESARGKRLCKNRAGISYCSLWGWFNATLRGLNWKINSKNARFAKFLMIFSPNFHSFIFCSISWSQGVALVGVMTQIWIRN